MAATSFVAGLHSSVLGVIPTVRLNGAPECDWLPSVKFTATRFSTSRSMKASCELSKSAILRKAGNGKATPLQAHSGQAAKNSEVEDASSPSQGLLTGTVKSVMQAATRAVEDTPVTTVGAAALYSGVAAMGTLMASAVLGQLEVLPLLPEALQTMGVAYCSLVASRYMNSQRVDFAPSSPIRSMIEIVDGQDLSMRSPVDIPEGIENVLKEQLIQLGDERDQALQKVHELRAAGVQMGRLVAERETLHALAAQLAVDRDSAVSEVTSLKGAVTAMASRVSAVEEMLHREIKSLDQKNRQLAAQRNAAVAEVSDLKVTVQAMSEEAQRVQELAEVLRKEKEQALEEVAELQEVIVSLRGSVSGLTVQQEIFIKARARAVKSQFINVSVAYNDQKEAVDGLVAHLVKEYGAPKEWTTEYMKQFLKSSAQKTLTSPAKISQVQNVVSKS